jgi:hypothetical protein
MILLYLCFTPQKYKNNESNNQIIKNSSVSPTHSLAHPPHTPPGTHSVRFVWGHKDGVHPARGGGIQHLLPYS